MKRPDPPREIYLQWEPSREFPDPWSAQSMNDVTWHKEEINEDDVRYFRADLVQFFKPDTELIAKAEAANRSRFVVHSQPGFGLVVKRDHRRYQVIISDRRGHARLVSECTSPKEALIVFFAIRTYQLQQEREDE